MYFERSKHGSERGLYKSTVEIQQDGTFLLYATYGSGTCYCKINGTTYSATVSPSQKITNSGINLFSKTLDIYHNNDGSKNLTCSAWIDMNTPLTSSEQSYSQTLSTIPRASKPTLSVSSVTMGNSITVNTNRASSSFTHSLYYQIGSGGWNTIGTGIGTSKSWTVPITFANMCKFKMELFVLNMVSNNLPILLKLDNLN